MNDIEVKNLRKTFQSGKVVAVDDVSFSVKKGEFFGLLGVNGAGKTTTINMLTGLLKMDSGSVKLLGHTLEENWEYVKNNINVSTAYFPLSDVLTVRQNLRVYARLYNVKNAEKKIDELLGKFELKKLANTRIIKLSSGETTRTALCKGLINDPKILFLDECTVGLDPDIAEKTRNILSDYQKDNKSTIFFTSHYMHEVEELCKRIAFMDQGKIIEINSAKNLKKHIKEQTIEITVKSKALELKKFLQDENIDVLFAKKNTLIFEVTSKQDKVYKIMNKIFKKGFLLKDLHIKKPTLDDVFIKFARGKK